MSISVSTLNEIKEIQLQKPDYMLGKGLQMPFSGANSGSRKLMFGTQLEHRLGLLKPEVAFIQTGYEMEYGKKSSSYIQPKEAIEIIGRVAKYSWLPTHHYYLFAKGLETNTIYVFERKEYKHTTENYGYLFDNSFIDKCTPGCQISKDRPIMRSLNFDEYDNRMDGRNLLTLYTSSEKTMEDAILISESASKKLTSPLIKKCTIVINDNDLPINLYGDMEDYKIFPDINEEVSNNILLALRREKKEEALFSQSYSRLRELFISDEKYTVSGRVVDIDIACNSPETLVSYAHNVQLLKYHTELMRMSREIVEMLTPYIEDGYEFDYETKKLYSTSRSRLEGKKYFSEKVFSNIIMDIYLIEDIPVFQGDKLTNRYGGKGISSRVIPDNMMPKTMDGKTIDVLLNICGVFGRENIGQLFEMSVNFISMKIIETIRRGIWDVGRCFDMYLQLLDIVSPSMAKYVENLLQTAGDDDEAISIISSFCEDDCFYMAIEPIGEPITIDKIAKLYETFSWINQEYLLMPNTDSTGKIVYTQSRRPLVYGYQYFYRLKQYAEEKFSVTSLSATNIRNENSKSKSSNNHKALYSRTPIRFGDMETGHLMHAGGAELIVQILMTYSTSPTARREAAKLIFGDAFDIDIKLDGKSKNRNAEILNVYLKTIGLRLEFIKRLKKKQYGFTIQPIVFDKPQDIGLIHPVLPVHPEEIFNIEAEVKRLLNQEHNVNGIDIYPVEWFLKENLEC